MESNVSSTITTPDGRRWLASLGPSTHPDRCALCGAAAQPDGQLCESCMNAVTDIEDVATEFLERIEPWEFTEASSLDSSNIYALSYDHRNRTLYVQFQTLAIYKYAEVSEAEVADLLEAESIGKAFNAGVKTHHTYERV